MDITIPRVTKANICETAILAFSVMLAFAAIYEGKDVLGLDVFGVEIGDVWVVAIMFVIMLCLFKTCKWVVR